MARITADNAAWLLLSIILLTLPCSAQPGPGSLMAAASQRPDLAVAACDQARDPARCMAQQQARAACQSKRGAARRQCLREKMPAQDCSHAPDPRRCQARQQAHDACLGKTGKELRRCLRDYPVILAIPRPFPASAG